MNEAPQLRVGAPCTTHPIILEVQRVAEMRSVFHELANVFTGILITGGLLAQKLEGREYSGFAQAMCELGDRGAGLVREARSLLLGARENEMHNSGESEG